MADPRGTYTVKARGQVYRLHLGFSALADLQAEHGDDFLSRLEPPSGASAQWLPPLGIVVAVIVAALQRHHHDVESPRYVADDILAENPGCLGALMSAAFPDAKASAGNGKRPGRAA
jgi:hypothetical protein